MHDRFLCLQIIIIIQIDDFKQFISIIKQYFILSIYGQKKLLKISVILSLLIKLMDIWIQVLLLHQ